MKRKKLSKAERIEIHNKTDGHCAYCGIKIEIVDMQVDHVFPLNRGGLDEKENMLPACRSCNHYKSTFDLEDFREEIGKWHDRLIRDSVTYKNAVRFGVVTPTPLILRGAKMPFEVMAIILAFTTGAVWGFYFRGWRE